MPEYKGKSARQPWRRPTYGKNNPRGWCGDPRRGSALGRSNIFLEDPLTFEGAIWIAPVRVRWDGHDHLGTYWGLSPNGGSRNDLFWVANAYQTIDAVISVNPEHAQSRGYTVAGFAVMDLRNRFPRAIFKIPKKWERYPYLMEQISEFLTPDPIPCEPM
jgi:hypothetical protein